MTEDRPNPLTLAVTSSTGVMSVAVGRADETREVVVHNDRRHAEELMPLVQQLVADSGASLADLELLAVDVGPGRFTGLRVGVATVRALAFALRIPVVAVTSLELLAAAAERATEEQPNTVTAVIDARRQEVFLQRFVAGRPDGDAVVGRPEDLVSSAAGVVVGDGADRYADHWRTAPVTIVAGVHPGAAEAITLGAERRAVAGTAVTPVYLRDPDAVANIRTRAPQVDASEQEAVTP
jgi:tRNA threonylcarbamoyladenosine biosynthesis protein TsaB